MTEFTHGIVNTMRNKFGDSILLSVVFFIGHILIAMTVVSLMTGASLWEAGSVAVVEPAINSIWFYIVHKIYDHVKKN